MRFRRVIDRSIRYTRAQPQNALEYYLKMVPEADQMIETDAFKLTLPYYAHSQKLDKAGWQVFADFALQHGLIENAVDVRTVIWSDNH